MKIFFLLLLFVLGFAWPSFATLQMPEKMSYKGRTGFFRDLYPLEDYFRKNNISLPDSGVRSSALSRGYVGTYTVRADYLVLQDLEVEVYDDQQKDSYWKSIISDMPEPIPHLRLDWFSGILVLPYNTVNVNGENKIYSDNGWSEHYDRYFVLEFKNGLLTKEKDLPYKEFLRYRKRQFEIFKQTAKYMDELAKHEQEKKENEAYRRSDQYKQSRWYKMEREFGIQFKSKDWFDEYLEETVFYHITELAG